MNYSKILTLIAGFGLLILDQVTKYLFYDLGYGTDRPWITKALNTGISWSLPLHMDVTIVVTCLALVLFVWMIIKKQLSLIVGVLLISGAIGNLIDRIRWSGVRDFIHIGSFPVFNIADMILTIAIILYLLQEFRILQRLK